MFRDVAMVADEYQLEPANRKALMEVFQFHHVYSEKPALDAEPLVKQGAHPIGALMAVHVLQKEFRQQQN